MIEGLGHRNLGPLGLAGGVNLDVGGNPISGINIADDESPFSVNLQHFRGFLIPRDELASFIGPNASGTPATFPALATPTGYITCLSQALFENRTSFLMIHDLAHLWSFNGSTVTDLSGVGVITAGGDTTPWRGTMIPGFGTAATNSIYGAVNGANELIFWDGAAAAAVQLVGTAAYIAIAGNPAALIGKYIEAFAGRTFIAHTIEGGNTLASRIRCSSDGNIYDWNTARRTGAMAADLLDAPGAITGLRSVAGEMMYVFKESATIIAHETGDIAAPITFPTYLGVGSPAGHASQLIGDQSQVIFLGSDANIYVLQGASVQPVGNKIQKDLLRKLDWTKTDQIVSWTRPDLGQFWLAIPLEGNTYATRLYCYNWQENHWDTHEVGTPISSAASINYNTSNIKTWDTSSGTWDAQTTIWDDFSATVSSHKVVVGVDYGGPSYRVHKFVGSTTGVDAANVARSVTGIYRTKTARFNQMGESTVYGLVVYSYAVISGTITVDIYSEEGSNQIDSVALPVSAGRNRTYFPFAATSAFHYFALRTGPSIAVIAVEPVVAMMNETNG